MFPGKLHPLSWGGGLTSPNYMHTFWELLPCLNTDTRCCLKDKGPSISALAVSRGMHSKTRHKSNAMTSLCASSFHFIPYSSWFYSKQLRYHCSPSFSTSPFSHLSPIHTTSIHHSAVFITHFHCNKYLSYLILVNESMSPWFVTVCFECRAP